MAQGDLYRLLKRVSMGLAKDMDSKGKGSERFRIRVEKYPHDVYLNRNDIRDEILIQLNDFRLTDEQNRARIANKEKPIQQGARVQFGSGSGRSREESAMAIRSLANTNGLTAAQVAAVEKEADLFVSSAISVAKSARRAGIRIEILSNVGGNVVLRFHNTTRNANVYGAINDLIFKPAKDRLARNLSRVGFDINNDKKAIFFNVGHINAVSTVKAAKAISLVNTGLHRIGQKYDDPLGKEAADMIRVGIASKFTQFGNPELTKQFLIKAATVRPESQATNLTDSDYEAALLRDVRNSLRDSLASLPNDWANQKGSDSAVDAIAIDLLNSAAKSMKHPNIKITGQPRKANMQAASTKDDSIALKKPKVTPKRLTTKDFGAINVPNPYKGQNSSPISLANLIPMLNANLTEIIKRNMGQAGRLHTRTGRFAESAQIVAIDEASFSIGYTYQMNPYAVFEGQGSRDPRPLIEMSIREAAVGIMNARFNIRRL